MRGPRKGVGGRRLIVDTNVLLLFLVGSLDLDLITKHKRVQQFTVEDFHLLDNLLRQFGAILTTPNVLTEVTNLAMQGGAAKERLVTWLAALLQKRSIRGARGREQRGQQGQRAPASRPDRRRDHPSHHEGVDCPDGRSSSLPGSAGSRP